MKKLKRWLVTDPSGKRIEGFVSQETKSDDGAVVAASDVTAFEKCYQNLEARYNLAFMKAKLLEGMNFELEEQILTMLNRGDSE